MVPKNSHQQAPGSHVRTPRKGRGDTKRDPVPDPSATNSLHLIAFRNGSKGFMARSQDSASLAFFDEDGDPILCDPGWNMVVRKLGDYLPGDQDGFWALVARV